ncbi:MAG: hypothetical protein RBU37_19275 [Myxococcota bacterium]|jgi:hypothetical protein|nr:hypothetical protein [Myxococcota bacterium]
MRRLIALCLLAPFFSLACYNSYTIPKSELARLQSGQETEGVVVRSVDEEDVEIAPETPLEVVVDDDVQYRITPYNFLLSESQLVSPDYDLLLPAESVQYATVRETSYLKTFGLVGPIGAAVGAGFTVMALR